jgi:hypothetical protein
MKQGKPKYSSNPNNQALTDQSKYKYNRNKVMGDVYSRIKGLDKLNKTYNSLSPSGKGNQIG